MALAKSAAAAYIAAPVSGLLPVRRNTLFILYAGYTPR
jgi:hypothetical protein